MPRFFIHPEPRVVKLPNGTNSEAIKFASWIVQVIAHDPKGATGGIASIRRVGRVCDAIEATAPGDVVELVEDDWRHVKGIVEQPAAAELNMFVFRQLVDWLELVVDASDKRPVSETTNGTAKAATA